MPSRLQIQIVALVVVLILAGGVWVTGDQIKQEWFRFLGGSVFIATIALALWDRIMWRWLLIQKIELVPLEIDGTWKGTLTSLWVDPQTGASPSPKTVYLVVRQTASSVSVVFLSDESRSESSLAKVERTFSGHTLNYIYMNRPRPQYEDRSRMHWGTSHFDIAGRPPTSMEGKYWTDRETRGELRFTERVRRNAGDYDAAAALPWTSSSAS